MSVIYDAVKTIVIYLILVAIVMNLLGTSSYKKYVAMFTGMLLIYIVITPVMKLFHLTSTMDYHFEENSFKVEAKDMNGKIFDVDENQKSYIIEGYRLKLEKQIEEFLTKKDLTLKECDLTVDEDMSSESFGSVLSINLVAKEFKEELKEEQDSIITEISIEKIEIGEEIEKSSDIPKTDSVLEIEIKKELAKLYDIDTELVQVDIDYRE